MKLQIQKLVGLATVMVLMACGTVFGAFDIKVTSSDGPTKNAPTLLKTYLENGLNQVKTTDTLPAGEKTSPTDARRIEYTAPERLMASPVDVPFFRGSFSPAAEWNGMRGEGAWIYVDVRVTDVSPESTEMVTLAEIKGHMRSTDGNNNALGKTFTFEGTSYSSTAIGIRKDGTLITEGSATQPAKRIIVAVGSKSFLVTSTTEVEEVHDYLNNYPGWSLICKVEFRHSSKEVTLFRALPSLMASQQGDLLQVVASLTGDPNLYSLRGSPQVGTEAQWTVIGNLRQGETNMVAINKPTYFVQLYRATTAASGLIPPKKQGIKIPLVVDLSI